MEFQFAHVTAAHRWRRPAGFQYKARRRATPGLCGSRFSGLKRRLGSVVTLPQPVDKQAAASCERRFLLPALVGLSGPGERHWLFTPQKMASYRSQRLSSPEPSGLPPASNSEVLTALSDVQEGQRPSPSLLPPRWDKTRTAAPSKGRFSDFVSDFLPFVVLSWSPNKAWHLLLFCSTSSAWTSVKGEVSERAVLS